MSNDDIGPIRTFKRTHVREKSISENSSKSNSSLRSSGRLTLDKGSIKRVKQQIKDDETSVIEMYYSNMDNLIRSQS